MKLFRTTILHADEYQKYMTNTSRNWDFSRLAYMDVVIMQIAIAEMLTFPAIPVSVTINEYVDLAKNYSTPKSGRYINGMLDAIARMLSESGKMLKPMPEKQQRYEERDDRARGGQTPQHEHGHVRSGSAPRWTDCHSRLLTDGKVQDGIMCQMESWVMMALHAGYPTQE